MNRKQHFFNDRTKTGNVVGDKQRGFKLPQCSVKNCKVNEKWVVIKKF